MLISIEGVDGSGKSTLCQALYEQLSKNRKCLLTHEPGGTEMGEEVRRLFLNSTHDLDPLTETLLILAARRHHIHNVIVPAIAREEVVICDRFHESTIAYQGYGRGLGGEYVDGLCASLCETSFPRVTFWIDLAPSEVGRRLRSRSHKDRIEREGPKLQSLVYKGYVSLAIKHSSPFFPLDGRMSPSCMAKKIESIVGDILPQYASV